MLTTVALSLAVSLLVSLLVVLLALCATYCILTGVLAVILTSITTSVGHFILRDGIFFTQVGRFQIFARPTKGPNRLRDFSLLFLLQQNALPFH